jgi:hypothetical protein
MPRPLIAIADELGLPRATLFAWADGIVINGKRLKLQTTREGGPWGRETTLIFWRDFMQKKAKAEGTVWPAPRPEGKRLTVRFDEVHCPERGETVLSA